MVTNTISSRALITALRRARNRIRIQALGRVRSGQMLIQASKRTRSLSRGSTLLATQTLWVTSIRIRFASYLQSASSSKYSICMIRKESGSLSMVSLEWRAPETSISIQTNKYLPLTLWCLKFKRCRLTIVVKFSLMTRAARLIPANASMADRLTFLLRFYQRELIDGYSRTPWSSGTCLTATNIHSISALQAAFPGSILVNQT